jgi:hypothetical protein
MTTATMTRPVARPAARSGAGPVVMPVGLRCDGRAASAAAPPRRQAHTRARLTRRGRIVLVLLASALLLAAISIGRAGSQAATAVENGPALQQTTVQSGETLWSVAQRIAPANDPREVVAQIRRINHLPSSSLRVGQQLLLPVVG